MTTRSSGLAACRRKAVHRPAALPVPAGAARVARLAAGCAGLALLAACSAGGGNVALGPSTNYYMDHASPASYRPPGPPSDPWGPYIRAASQRFDVPTSWIRNVMRVESGGNEYMDGHLTVSAAGAMGLMQLEPETYREMAAQFGLGPDPFNPYDNIMAGTAYIHEMYAIFGSPGFLAAYNAGPGRLDEYVNDRVPLPQETQTYVAMIAPRIEGDYPGASTADVELAMNTPPEGSNGGTPAAGGSQPSPAPVASLPQNVAVAQTALPAPVSTVPVQTAAPETRTSSVSALYTPTRHYAARVPAPPPPQPQPQPHFALIPAAMADTPPATPSHEAGPAAPGGWAIQVGAYNSPGDAKAALGIAELSAVQMLLNGRPVVMSVNVRGHLFYRARFAGLAHEAAVNACNRLSSGPTGCLVLSPDAQS